VRNALVALGAALGIALSAPAWTQAATITVQTNFDSLLTSGLGTCTLREAINNANSPSIDTTGGDCTKGTGSDTIIFGIFGTDRTIQLVTSLPAIVHSLTITGDNQGIILDGASAYTILTVNSGATLNVQYLTLAHGSAAQAEGGA
jgi:hypothetical protein